MTFRTMTLSIKGLYVTRIITMICHYAVCHVLFIFMLNVIMLSVVMLSVVAPTGVDQTIKKLIDYRGHHTEKLIKLFM
jgi:hypothetical protein